MEREVYIYIMANAVKNIMEEFSVTAKKVIEIFGVSEEDAREIIEKLEENKEPWKSFQQRKVPKKSGWFSGFFALFCIVGNPDK